MGNNDTTVSVLSAEDAASCIDDLADVLIECVESGASVSFMSPLSRAKAEAFWRDVVRLSADGALTIMVARAPGAATILGTVQLVWAAPENQPHRADVAKLLVRPSARRRGIAASLMGLVEQVARSAGKTLLVLDTASGGSADALYRRMNWTAVGVIPDYALSPDGRPCDTTIFYKRIEP